MKQFIYLFEFPNGKYYVGRTDDIARRFAEHKSAAKKKKKHQLYWAIRKYGWDSINKTVIAEASTLEEVIALEYENIVKYDSLRNGYNMTNNTEIGGDNWVGRKDSEEYQEFVERMKILNGSNKMHGKSHTEEAKALQKEKAKGRFSLPWFIERNGEEEGTRLYEQRRNFLKNRTYNRDPATGDFIKKA